MNLVQELNSKSEELTIAVRRMAQYGREMAKAEQNYYIAKAQETERLQAEGVPATNINNVVKGHVAKELFEMQTTEVMYKTSIEKINAIKKQIEIIEIQLKLEWNQAGKEI